MAAAPGASTVLAPGTLRGAPAAPPGVKQLFVVGVKPESRWNKRHATAGTVTASYTPPVDAAALRAAASAAAGGPPHDALS